MSTHSVFASSAQKVLIADGNHDAADSLAMLFELEGYDVRSVYDGRRVLDLIQTFEPGMVFLEIILPGLDGCTVARKIRTEPTPRPAPLLVAVTTGHCGDFCQVKCHRHDQPNYFNYYIRKPYDFLNVLGRVLN